MLQPDLLTPMPELFPLKLTCVSAIHRITPLHLQPGLSRSLSTSGKPTVSENPPQNLPSCFLTSWFIQEGASVLHSAGFLPRCADLCGFISFSNSVFCLQFPVESEVPVPACSPALTSLLPSASPPPRSSSFCSFILSNYPDCVILWQPFKGLV